MDASAVQTPAAYLLFYRRRHETERDQRRRETEGWVGARAAEAAPSADVPGPSSGRVGVSSFPLATDVDRASDSMEVEGEVGNLEDLGDVTEELPPLEITNDEDDPLRIGYGPDIDAMADEA